MNEDRKMTHFVVVSIHSSRFDCSGNDDDVSSGNSVRSHFSIFNVAYRIRYATASANSGEFIRIISSFFVLFDIQSHTKARCRRYCVVFASWRASVRAASIVDETSTSVRGVSALWFLCLKKRCCIVSKHRCCIELSMLFCGALRLNECCCQPRNSLASLHCARFLSIVSRHHHHHQSFVLLCSTNGDNFFCCVQRTVTICLLIVSSIGGSATTTVLCEKHVAATLHHLRSASSLPTVLANRLNVQLQLLALGNSTLFVFILLDSFRPFLSRSQSAAGFVTAANVHATITTFCHDRLSFRATVLALNCCLLLSKREY